jgi:hypothetical protein
MADVTSDQENKKMTPAAEPARILPATEAPLPDWALPAPNVSVGPGLGAPDGHVQRLADSRLARNASRESRVRLMTGMQRQLGNHHVQRMMAGRQFLPVQRQGPGEAEPQEEPGKEVAAPFELKEDAVTNVDYNSPAVSTKDEKVKPFVPPKDVSPEDDKVDVSAKAVCIYTTTITVNLPTPPSGLTACQTKRVQEAIDKKLAPHEAQHKAAMKQYDGTYVEAFELKQILRSTVDAALTAKAIEIGDTQRVIRQKAAQDASDKLDQPPFIVKVDLNCVDKVPDKKQAEGAGAEALAGGPPAEAGGSPPPASSGAE